VPTATPTVPAALTRAAATRYVLPLREGGSLPAIVEADDLGTYVLKFRGAGQGTKALVAELAVGLIGRGLGLPVPELVLLDLDGRLADAEPDEEVQDLIRASLGLNLGVDYLPGSLDLAPSVFTVTPELAADTLWFDAFVDNVDRTWRNPNLLLWHGSPWLIDHGAALYWHHDPTKAYQAVSRPLVGVDEHIMLPHASNVRDAHARLAPQVTEDFLTAVFELVPDEWLLPRAHSNDLVDPPSARRSYVDHLLARIAATEWVEALEVARAAAV
jgi:hypothetical protein